MPAKGHLELVTPGTSRRRPQALRGGSRRTTDKEAGSAEAQGKHRVSQHFKNRALSSLHDAS